MGRWCFCHRPILPVKACMGKIKRWASTRLGTSESHFKIIYTTFLCIYWLTIQFEGKAMCSSSSYIPKSIQKSHSYYSLHFIVKEGWSPISTSDPAKAGPFRSYLNLDPPFAFGPGPPPVRYFLPLEAFLQFFKEHHPLLQNVDHFNHHGGRANYRPKHPTSFPRYRYQFCFFRWTRWRANSVDGRGLHCPRWQWQANWKLQQEDL